MSASPDTSPFDQNLSELSDNEPSASTSSSVPRIKLKIRLNPTPSYSDHDRVPDDNSSRKHKRKKKRSHKKHKHAKHSDDNDKPHGQQHRRHSELVDIDDYDDYGSDDNIGNGNGSIPSAGDDLTSAHSPQEDQGPHYQHIPVGGKRPFAMLQQQQQQPDEDGTYVNGKGAHNHHLYRQASLLEDDEDGYTDEDNQMDDSNNNNIDDDEDGEYEYDYDERALDESTIYHPTDTTTAATKKTKSSRSGKTPNKAASKSKKKPSKQLQSRTSADNTAQKKRGRPTKKAQAKSAHASLSSMVQQQQQSHHGFFATKDYKKDIKTACLKLWDTLSKRDDYGFFLEPVNTKLVRDYLTVIKQPMDFSTLRQKIENGSYTTMDDFRTDFLLIVQNAKLYNAPDTIYWKSADKLESYGIKAIDRAEKLVQESFASQPPPPPPSLTPRANSRQYPWQQQQYSRKDSTTVKEEEVDILGLDGPARKASRAESERTTREPSLDTSLSRATTPMRQHMKKKKKKKMTDAGVIYGPDGSIHAVGGVNDLHSLLPMKQSFSDRPQLTTINPQALPSAFYQVNRSIHDDWANHKHFIQPSVFCDYGPFPFTTLGSSTPAMFYRPQDAHYVFPLYGDDTGEAYLKSVWQYMGDLGLDEKATSLSRHITRGAYDVMAAVIDNMDLVTEKKVESANDCDDDIDIDTDGTPSNISEPDDSVLVKTEFGAVNVGAFLKGLQQQSVSGVTKVDVGETLSTQEPLQSNYVPSLPVTNATEPISAGDIPGS